MSDDRAVQAAAEALGNADGPAFVGSANRRFVAEVAVAAAREVIEAEAWSSRTIAVRCPRCADRIDLSLGWRAHLSQNSPGRKAFITADVAVGGIEHTCPAGAP